MEQKLRYSEPITAHDYDHNKFQLHHLFNIILVKKIKIIIIIVDFLLFVCSVPLCRGWHLAWLPGSLWTAP